MKEKIVCVKCGEEINPKKDEWYKVILFIKEKISSEIFYHRECYKEFHKDKFKEEYDKRMKMLSPILNKVLNRPIYDA